VRKVFAGDRRVWVVAGGTFGALLVAVVVALALPRDYFTGTNSVAVQSIVKEIPAGRPLCVPNLYVPAGTGRVRFAAFWPKTERRAFGGTLAGEGTTLAGAAGPTRPVKRIAIPFKRLDRGGRYTFCVRALGGRIGIGGKYELVGRHPLATIGGRPLRSEVAIWFLPPKGERRSALSMLPEAFRRAALFRPGIVGAWTYALLLIVGIPCLGLVAIRLLALRVAGLRRGGRTALAIGALAFACAATWALLTPPFDAPDEPEHFAYAQSLAETGRAPQKGVADRPAYSTELATVLNAVKIYARVQERDERPPWLSAAERGLDANLARPGIRSDNGGGYLVSTSTHAPPYYALAAAAYLAVRSNDPVAELTAMRLVSALLGALTAAFTFLALRELFPRHEWVAAAGGLLVAFQPMFGFIAGSVNNDNGVNATAALLLFLLIRGLRRGLTLPLGLATGATMVALPLFKGTGYALLPAAVIALAGMVVRRHSRRDLPGYAALAGAFAAGQAAWAAVASFFDRSAYTTPGGAAPVSSNGLVGSVLRQPLDYANYLWQTFLPRLPFMKDVALQRWPAYDIYVERGWAAFGWYAQMFPTWVNLTIAAVMLLTGAACVVAVFWRERPAARRRALELAVLVAALAGVIGGVAAAYQTGTIGRPVVAEQGRYAFTAMVPLAAIAVGGTFAFGRRRAPLLAGGLVAAVAGIAVASYFLALTRFYM
jgi:hypothetical protein